jgi:hypothetical protein
MFSWTTPLNIAIRTYTTYWYGHTATFESNIHMGIARRQPVYTTIDELATSNDAPSILATHKLSCLSSFLLPAVHSTSHAVQTSLVKCTNYLLTCRISTSWPLRPTEYRVNRTAYYRHLLKLSQIARGVNELILPRCYWLLIGHRSEASGSLIFRG